MKKLTETKWKFILIIALQLLMVAVIIVVVYNIIPNYPNFLTEFKGNSAESIPFAKEFVQKVIDAKQKYISSFQGISVLKGCVIIFLLFLMFVISRWLKTIRIVTAFDTSKNNGTRTLWVQIFTISNIFLFIWGVIVITGIDTEKGKLAVIFTIITAVIACVYPDILKSIIAYFHLYNNNHLHIGDWIIVPKYGIDGMVKSISIISVTIKNWDNSISSVPTYILLNEHMMNYQTILDKCAPRKMMKTFNIDSSSVRSMVLEDVVKLKAILENMGMDTITLNDVDLDYPVLNLQLFRKFIHHWLMNNNDICHQPRLLARIMEPTPEGVPIQIYVFLLKHGLEDFERAQASIIEFVLMSMKWFGLRLYQRPSDYQISRLGNKNSTDYAADETL